MTRANEICESCGADPFKTIDYDMIIKEKYEIGQKFKRLHADHGLEKAQWILREIELTESMKYLQQKTLKQAAAIRNLEAKLKRLGQQPYREEGPEEFTVKLNNGKIVIEDR